MAESPQHRSLDDSATTTDLSTDCGTKYESPDKTYDDFNEEELPSLKLFDVLLENSMMSTII